jgi:hypothetical protein
MNIKLKAALHTIIILIAIPLVIIGCIELFLYFPEYSIIFTLSTIFLLVVRLVYVVCLDVLKNGK